MADTTEREPGLFDERARSDYGAHARGRAGTLHCGRPGRVVQHGRHAPEGGQSEHGAHGRDEVGQQHTHVLARCAETRGPAPDDERALEQILVGARLLFHVLDDEGVATLLLHSVEEGFEQGAARAAFERCRLHQLLQLLSGARPARAGGGFGCRADARRREHRIHTRGANPVDSAA